MDGREAERIIRDARRVIERLELALAQERRDHANTKQLRTALRAELEDAKQKHAAAVFELGHFEITKVQLAELSAAARAFTAHYFELGRDEHVSDRLVRELEAARVKAGA